MNKGIIKFMVIMIIIFSIYLIIALAYGNNKKKNKEISSSLKNYSTETLGTDNYKNEIDWTIGANVGNEDNAGNED